MKLNFPAVEVKDGRLALNQTQMDMVKALLAKQKAPYLQVTFQPPRRPRTTGAESQSHRINGFIAQICVATGDDFDRLKVELKQKAISRGYPFDTVNYKTPDGVLVEMAIAWSETRLSVEEASILIATVEQDAAEKGVALIE